ncbi:unnamed protein product [Meganyctiphanes norvegica]|uniref:Uncharacterized protein n=1 Tax=Meganyctiphanes norvegica TaxID=48144 RepID=A0AAV2QLM1_MEGNR
MSAILTDLWNIAKEGYNKIKKVINNTNVESMVKEAMQIDSLLYQCVNGWFVEGKSPSKLMKIPQLGTVTEELSEIFRENASLLRTRLLNICEDFKDLFFFWWDLDNNFSEKKKELMTKYGREMAESKLKEPSQVEKYEIELDTDIDQIVGNYKDNMKHLGITVFSRVLLTSSVISAAVAIGVSIAWLTGTMALCSAIWIPVGIFVGVTGLYVFINKISDTKKGEDADQEKRRKYWMKKAGLKTESKESNESKEWENATNFIFYLMNVIFNIR